MAETVRALASRVPRSVPPTHFPQINDSLACFNSSSHHAVLLPLKSVVLHTSIELPCRPSGSHAIMSLSRCPVGTLSLQFRTQSTTRRCANRRVFQQNTRAATSQLPNPSSTQATRGFSSTASRSTDGVFRELTSARVPTPWIEALRREEVGLEVNEVVSDAKEAKEAKERRMVGKRMSESYHSVVLPLARDPWLGDTYLNSSGHIRYALCFRP